MTKEETKHMDAKFKEQKENHLEQKQLILGLTNVVTPLVTKVAIVEERQKEHPKENKLYAVVGALAALLIAALAIVIPLIMAVKK